MSNCEQTFLQHAIDCEALQFGEFTLKSGRKSPYFFNAGRFDRGAALAGLARCYAETIKDSGLAVDMLFGPAYKGIALAATTVCALSEHFATDLPWAYNRKEAKDHGEGGVLVGAALSGNVLIIDDVITAGTAIRQSIAMIRDAGATVAGVVVGLDRQERGAGGKSSIAELEAEFGIRVLSIARLSGIVDYLRARNDYAAELAALQEYRAHWAA